MIPAFSEYKAVDLMTMLTQRDVTVREDCNILRRCSQGAQSLFIELQTATKFSTVTKKSFTDDDGKIRTGIILPALSKRFNVTGCIGGGTFSQIYSAEDRYDDRAMVAVKCLKHRFDILGCIELTFLRYLNRKNAKGTKYFVRIIDAFSFDGHTCIAMEYFKATLAKFMNASPIDSSAVIGPNKIHLLNVHRPTPRISYASNSTVSSDPRINSTPPSLSFGEDIVKIQKIALSLCSALCILRKEGIIHADIKPENIFINWDDSSSSSFRHSVDMSSEICSLHNLPDHFEVRLGTYLNICLMLNNGNSLSSIAYFHNSC